jgi:hypothetical protein
MSRTIDTPATTSPVKKFISFNGNLGKFGVISDGEKDMVDIPYPFTFVVVDNDAFNIGGATSLEDKAPRFSSNMGHRAFSSELTVSLAGNVVASGSWASLKTNPALSKARYQGLIFAIADLGQGKELVRISLHGKALFEWGTFTKTVNVLGDTAVQVKEAVETKSEKTGLASKVPVFTAVNVSKETLDLAAKTDTAPALASGPDFPTQEHPAAPPITVNVPTSAAPASNIPSPAEDGDNDLPF